MAKKPAAKKRKAAPTPEEIVAAWHKEIVNKLKPWFLDDEVFEEVEPLLQDRITELVGEGQEFTQKAMKESLQVARDMAKICKLLQPKPHPKRVDLDTFQAVLDLCSTHHMVCQSGGGAGGWCNINS